MQDHRNERRLHHPGTNQHDHDPAVAIELTIHEVHDDLVYADEIHLLTAPDRLWTKYRFPWTGDELRDVLVRGTRGVLLHRKWRAL